MTKASNIVKLDRKRVTVKPNELITYKNNVYKITQILNFDEIICVGIENKKAIKLAIDDLQGAKIDEKEFGNICKDIYDIDDTQYQKALDRYKKIEPMLKKEITRSEIESYSNEIGIHFTTLYRWLDNYKSTGTILGLIPNKTGGKEGAKRISKDAEIVISDIIKSYYLTPQKPSIQSLINKILSECNKRNIVPPSKNTIRNRVDEISNYEKLKKQGSRSIARTKYEPAPNSFEADYPLQLVEIDHTVVDIILVDDDSRKPIGRPYITVAIDIYSRMIVGYYLSMNPPSVTSVGMCISNAILPKDNILLKNEISSNWNAWGFPETIHVDNGADFRAEAIQKAGLAHGINIEFRPVGRANFGGHIERVIGTLMKEVHNLPGTTFSNIKERGEYDADANAILTFSDFEKWLLGFITKIYHKRLHHGIDTTPEKQWEEGMFGDGSPIGFVPKPTNADTIIIDFLPFYNRTIQKNGVNIEGLNYYDNVLRIHINEMDDLNKHNSTFAHKTELFFSVNS